MSKLPLGTLWLLCGGICGWHAHSLWQSYSLDPIAGNATPVVVSPSRSPDRPLSNDSDANAAELRLRLQPLLADHLYSEAVALCESYRLQNKLTAELNCRSMFLTHAQHLGKQQAYARAVQLLQAYLEVDFRSIEVREHIADWLLRSGQYLPAIQMLYEARGYAHQTATLERLSATIHAQVHAYAQRLFDRHEYEQAKQLYESVSQLEPEYAAYFYHLGKALLGLEEYGRAQAALSLIAYDPQYGRRAQELLGSVAQQLASMNVQETQIPLLRTGDHFIVEASINRQHTLRLLIDTGASMTMINSSVLQALGIAYSATQQLQWFNTAGGKVKAPVVQLASMALLDKEVGPLEVVALELEDFSHADGLLGMNYLTNFVFFIDQENNVLRLQRAQ